VEGTVIGRESNRLETCLWDIVGGGGVGEVYWLWICGLLRVCEIVCCEGCGGFTMERMAETEVEGFD
jgi:hypothetical protein